MTEPEELAKGLWAQFWPDRDQDWIDRYWAENGSIRENYLEVAKWFLGWLWGRDLTSEELAVLSPGCVGAFINQAAARVARRADAAEAALRKCVEALRQDAPGCALAAAEAVLREEPECQNTEIAE